MPLGTTSLVQATTSLVHAVQSFHQFLPYTIRQTYLSMKTTNCQNMRTSFLQHKSISILKWNKIEKNERSKYSLGTPKQFEELSTLKVMLLHVSVRKNQSMFQLARLVDFFFSWYILSYTELPSRKLIILILSCEMDWFYSLICWGKGTT